MKMMEVQMHLMLSNQWVMSRQIKVLIESVQLAHPHQQVKPPLAPPQMNLKRRRASVAVLLRSKPPVPIDVGATRRNHHRYPC